MTAIMQRFATQNILADARQAFFSASRAGKLGQHRRRNALLGEAAALYRAAGRHNLADALLAAVEGE
jgi:hypothetical protein